MKPCLAHLQTSPRALTAALPASHALQVERLVATRIAEGGQALCLVKWRGLECDKATWEPRQELEKEEGEALDKVGDLAAILQIWVDG